MRRRYKQVHIRGHPATAEMTQGKVGTAEMCSGRQPESPATATTSTPSVVAHRLLAQVGSRIRPVVRWLDLGIDVGVLLQQVEQVGTVD